MNMQRLVLWFSLAGILIWGTAVAGTVPAGDGKPEPPELQRLVDLKQSYAISFLWFDRLAEGSLSLQREGAAGHFRAVLEARSLGAAAWLTADRVQRYETVMEWSPAEGRLRPIEHSAHMIKGRGKKRTDQTKYYLFNDSEHRVEVKRIRNGEVTSGRVLTLAGELPDDFLTAFFNFTLGVYGPVKEGGRYSIPSLTRHGETTIEAEILPPAEWPSGSFFPHTGLLLKVILDPDVLDTGGGAVYALLGSNGLPQRGIVENVLGLGDVRGVGK